MTNAQLHHKQFLKLFYEEKCLTLEVLSKKLNYSVRSNQRLLKKTGYYSSFTNNNKWYVLSITPSFDDRGLWFYNDIGFSKYGNLTQTIIHFVNKSSKGLTAKEICEIISIPCHTILSEMYKKKQIDRIKTKNGFVYISIEKKIKKRQTGIILKLERSPLPSDAEAVKILVKLLKNPNFTTDELCSSLVGKVICKPESIICFLQHHELALEKKTPNF